MAGVPRIYEKFYAAVQAGMNQATGVKKALVELGARAWGSGTPPSCAPGGRRAAGWRFSTRLADKLVFSKLRAKLGLDRCRFLISGGAPLAAEIAEFFHGTGLLILEGYGLTETTAAAFLNRLDRYRFGTVGPGAGRGRGEDRRRRRDPDARPLGVQALPQQRRRPPPRPSTARAGSTPATSATSRTAFCASPIARRI